MNKTRREAIGAIIAKLGDISSEIENLKDEEQEYYDNMPESLQGGDKGQAAEQSVSALETARDGVDQAVSELEGIE